MYAHGNTATGKSLTWQYVTQKYTHNEPRQDVKVCMLDCMFSSETLEVYRAVLKGLFPEVGSDEWPARMSMPQFVKIVTDRLQDGVYYTIVFDNAIALMNIDCKLFRMLPSLARIVRKRIGVVYISRVPWQSFKRDLLVDFPQELRYPAYTEVEMKRILSQRFPSIYSSSMANYDCDSDNLPWDSDVQLQNVFRAVCDYIYQALQRSCNNVSEMTFLVSAFFPAVIDAIFNVSSSPACCFKHVIC